MKFLVLTIFASFFLLLPVFFGSAEEEAPSPEPIDINTASNEDLQKIRGIGPVMAERIIEMRANCYFYPLSSLMEIKGIGEATLNKIKEEGKAFVLPPKSAEDVILCQKPEEKQTEDALEEKTETSKIDINAAAMEALIKISHIGEIRAQELISLRPFLSLDELVKIRGIGDKSLQDIKEQGLAWVDPKLKPPETKKITESLETESAAIARPFKQKSWAEQAPGSLFILLVAFGLAVFSGIIILVLKKKLKIV